MPPAQAAGRQDLNPAQKAVLDELGAMASDRPEFDEDVGSHLRAALETVLEPHLDNLPSNEDVYLNKHRLGQVHGCETKFLAEEAEEFDREWVLHLMEVALARLATDHPNYQTALRLGLFEGRPTPRSPRRWAGRRTRSRTTSTGKENTSVSNSAGFTSLVNREWTKATKSQRSCSGRCTNDSIGVPSKPVESVRKMSSGNAHLCNDLG